MRGAQVGLAAPAEGVVVAFAGAFAAAVEHEHAVSVAEQHPRVRGRLGSSREGDDRGAVARGHVPGAERRPSLVARSRLVGPAEVDARTGERALCVAMIARPWGGRPGVEARTAAPMRPAESRAARAPRAPERRDTDSDEDDAGEPGEDRRDVSPESRMTMTCRTPSVAPPTIARAPAKIANQPRSRFGMRFALPIRSAAHASGTSPLARWSPAATPSSGSTKASSVTASATTASATRNAVTSPRGRRQGAGGPRARASVGAMRVAGASRGAPQALTASRTGAACAARRTVAVCERSARSLIPSSILRSMTKCGISISSALTIAPAPRGTRPRAIRRVRSLPYGLEHESAPALEGEHAAGLEARDRQARARDGGRRSRRARAAATRGGSRRRCACRSRRGSRATRSCRSRRGPGRSAPAMARRRRRGASIVTARVDWTAGPGTSSSPGSGLRSSSQFAPQCSISGTSDGQVGRDEASADRDGPRRPAVPAHERGPATRPRWRPRRRGRRRDRTRRRRRARLRSRDRAAASEHLLRDRVQERAHHDRDAGADDAPVAQERRA